MRTAATAMERTSAARRLLPWILVALAIFLQGVASAADPCERRALDPRSARLQLVDITVTSGGVAGKVKNGSSGSDTAIDVVVWVNYFHSSRGGLIGQQCIVVGDMTPGEEREFTAAAGPEAAGAVAFNTSVTAREWR